MIFPTPIPTPKSTQSVPVSGTEICAYKFMDIRKGHEVDLTIDSKGRIILNGKILVTDAPLGELVKSLVKGCDPDKEGSK